MSLLFTLFQSSLRVVAAAVTGIALYYFARRFIRPQEYPFPPGPPAKPIFGNYFDLSKDKDWFTPDLYRQLSKKYESPILSLWVNGTHVIVVNTAEAVKDLFVTRGQNYAARGRMNVVHTISDMHWFTAMMQPNEEWKQNRKALTMNYKQNEYRGASTRSAHTMLRALLSSPDDFLEHFRRMNTATTMAITYGLDMDDGKNEKYVDIGKAIMHVLWDSSSSNAISVELLPRSLTFPKIFPGINYKTNPGKDMLEIPFEAAKRSIAEGRAKPSVVTNMLAQARTAKDEELASFTGANIYLSSANKVNAPVGAFVRAMLAYPEVQRRAQKDIDALLDGSRLPELSDGPSLPYIDAIVKEVLRWHVVAKFGAAPRAVVDDDVYKGYLLPKGAIIIPNIWAILHNPEEFPEPEKFKPERWFERPPGDFPFAVFGFGPRACPGVTFSRDMLWITFASILATFDIEPVLDYAGKPKIPNDDEGWGYKLFSYADPFEAKFAPRSDAAKQLVHATASEEPLTSG